MQNLNDGMLLYHGSYTEVHVPDLAKCAPYKDFGRGFYLTSSLKQAQSFARLSTKKARDNSVVDSHQSWGVVSSFRFHAPESGRLQTIMFENADAAWLHCVAGHRRVGTFETLVQDLQHYDIIGGKVANDQTNATLTLYMTQAFGPVGTKAADEMCIGLLLPERLTDQFCFRTDAALAQLEFVESERSWL